MLRTLAMTALLAGCAAGGSSISREELKPAQEYYEIKSRRYLYSQVVRVRTVGESLLNVLPLHLRPAEPEIYVGVLLDDLSGITGKVFGLPESATDPRAKQACLIVGVVPASPAERAGVRAGDLLLGIDGRRTPTIRKASEAVRRLKAGSTVFFTLEREGFQFDNPILIGEKPYPISFNVADAQEVNAFAAPGQIVVTTGLLRFIQSDDELAVVVAHELAHLTQGHLTKGLAPNIVAGVVEIAGLPVDLLLPGAGGLLGQAVRAPFSQDFEREADDIGLGYAHLAGYRMEAGLEFWDRFATELPKSLSQSFFNTHPTSPERLLRMERTIERIRSTS